MKAAVLKNIPGPPSQSFITGNLKQFFTRHGAGFQRDVALKHGSVAKLHGFFGNPLLYVSDPKALYNILIKEDHIFEETREFLILNSLIFGPSLVATEGDRHRKQRRILNPVFSVSHMRSMLPIFYNVVHKLRDAIAEQVADGSREIDVLHWAGRTALEIIGQGGLGYSLDSLTHNSENKYGDTLRSLTPVLQNVGVLARIAPYFVNLGPAWLRRWVIDTLPSQPVQIVKTIVDTMTTKSVEIYKEKMDAIQKGDDALVKRTGEGKDIMSVLMKANSAAIENQRLPEDELIAQMSTLIFAAMDTTSTATARTLQLLAEHQDIQAKLREEILQAGAGEHLSYDELGRLPLLDAVVKETLRVSPPGSVVFRAPNRDVVLPLSQPIVGIDGQEIHQIAVPKGTEILVGILGCNLKSSLWGEDTLEWKPERWLSPLPSAVTNAGMPGIYSNIMTFVGGKRACIGYKFAEMEMKIILSVLLSNFTFQPTGKVIEWNVSLIWYPTLGKDSNESQLPLKVGLYQAEDHQ
ncbi:cytochrome P450 [Wolfiporia cocos MD-104 SS10]|uniref:Cytochrome P450 n=1 Tax=Wolfiporia cocos (strain MD-104) TaxID=742152 RepID=A0A2H3JUZ1_WOLCO|nr:cytochrome P450 [Wolfiporia cocos MD-104 SS10]